MPRPELTAEQASSLTLQEYDHLRAAYSTLYQSLSLNGNDTVTLVTMEGDMFTIQVTSEGWKVIDGGTSSEKERTWEMVEDLLRSVSPLFKQGWDMMLLEKLHKLADDQELTHPEIDS
jgi:hypothetical protein